MAKVYHLTWERDVLVSGLANALKSMKGFELRAVSLSSFPRKPWPVGGFAPDVIAYDSAEELLQLADVITSNDLSSTEIGKKLLAHTRLVMASGASKGERVPLHIAVAVENDETLEELLGTLEIEDQVTVWTTEQPIAC